ncbi:FAD/NAD(P)-binding domain-containing protein [Phanerochaete sordida]|uniref:FAD/NAD(P)-binding domain-containing protein n=1 Tax=Phanerochaete sordida TaxID=48140 RepID=A0A9P3GHI1_9APHY|nr:FAD/NAD(P)-binding domain-containing protein [Phanerochaete sordida]
MSATKVIIVGAGIAGPLLAVQLKAQGYDPVIYERSDSISTAGLSLCLQANGLNVLAKSPGLVERLDGWPIDNMLFYSDLPADRGVLAQNDVPAQLRARYGPGFLGIRRPAVLRALVAHAAAAGVPVRWGHKLVGLEQRDDAVTVRFANGAEDSASFVVGCDGLHSNTRVCLFGESPADFTGLTQWGGISPIPEQLKDKSIFMNVFGDGIHLIAYQVSDSTISWAITQREAEAKETWRAMDEESAEEFRKTTPLKDTGMGVKELIQTGTNITKYGLYDRPELKTWHKGRVLLIGDAAHPTSPHLGQGANQAFEDVDLLVSLLATHNPGAAAPSTQTLGTVFEALEAVRIPRSSAMVQGARAQGESRVVSGVDACRARNDVFRRDWADPAAMMEKMVKSLMGPAK